MEIKSINKIGNSSDTKWLLSHQTCDPACCACVLWMCLL